MPIVNYFVIAGGLGYQFYKTMNNRATSNTEKMKRFGQTGARMASGFVGGLVGMAVGQIVIPVPVLGAFVGGVLGGVIF
jgi:phage tail tape-measure protein